MSEKKYGKIVLPVQKPIPQIKPLVYKSSAQIMVENDTRKEEERKLL